MRLKVRAAATDLGRNAFQAALGRHFLLRLHMFVILGGTFAIALATTKILLASHLTNLAWRYGIAVTAAFAGFLGFVRVWLGYIRVCATRSQQRDADWFNGFNFSSGGSGGSLPSPSSVFRGGGGSFGGGGASGSWGDPVASPSPPVVAVPVAHSSGSGGGFNLGDCVDDDLGLIILAVLLVVAIAAAALYLVYAAPAILGETAFQAALTASLANQTKKVDHASWLGSIIKATILPFIGICALAVLVGWYAQQHCPSATRLHDAFACTSR